MPLTHDRAPIIDFAGRQRASPALASDGAPTFVTGHGDASGARRVGWPAFFAAMNQRHLALRFDDASGEWKFVDRRARHEQPTPGEVSTGVKPPEPH
jgi:hypothetical protein